MFAQACKQARNFTIPFVTNVRTLGGRCGSGIATAVIINSEGWFMTAAHVIKNMNDLGSAEQRTRALEAAVSGANRQDRRSGRVKGPTQDDVDKWSVWLGYDGAFIELNSVGVLEDVDLAIGKISNVNLGHITNFPVLKDPSKDFEPGTSLCRYGFAFVDMKTTFDASTGNFILHNIPIPIFPNEGILGRIADYIIVDQNMNLMPLPYPHRMFETSSPGIKGQSGGPIFDRNGTLWGLQSATRSIPLEFNTKVAQFYHIGVAVHSETIVGCLRERGINFSMSDY